MDLSALPDLSQSQLLHILSQIVAELLRRSSVSSEGSPIPPPTTPPVAPPTDRLRTPPRGQCGFKCQFCDKACTRRGLDHTNHKCWHHRHERWYRISDGRTFFSGFFTWYGWMGFTYVICRFGWLLRIGFVYCPRDGSSGTISTIAEDEISHQGGEAKGGTSSLFTEWYPDIKHCGIILNFKVSHSAQCIQPSAE